jgi:glucosamine--fructose-6-phosphate aminotransferase (isomerizing)
MLQQPQAAAPVSASRYLADWHGQPDSLIRSAQALGDQWGGILEAGEWLRRCSAVLITGIGSSFHAALALESYLCRRGFLAKAVESSELVYNHPLPPGTGVVVASRSGESVEIVKLIDRCRELDVPVAAVTNVPASVLGRGARSVVDLRTDFDHLISLRMYTALVQGLLALGMAMCEPAAEAPVATLTTAWAHVAARLDGWHQAIRESGFFGPGNVYYALARGAQLAGAQEARLLLEECGKSGASSMWTSTFRHGSQEALGPQFRGMVWLPASDPMRGFDLALAAEIEATGARCAVIGTRLASTRYSGLALELPEVPADLQAVLDVVPLQIGAYEHALATGKDPDAFVYCPYVITTEGGL